MRNGTVIATVTRLRKHPYQLDSELIALCAPKGMTVLLATDSVSSPELTTWHYCCANLSPRWLKLLAKSEHVKGLEVAT